MEEEENVENGEASQEDFVVWQSEEEDVKNEEMMKLMKRLGTLNRTGGKFVSTHFFTIMHCLTLYCYPYPTFCQYPFYCYLYYILLSLSFHLP